MYLSKNQIQLEVHKNVQFYNTGSIGPTLGKAVFGGEP